MSNTTSQDAREMSASLTGGNTIVYVQYTSSFQWGLSAVNLVPLSTTLTVSSGTAVTFEFVQSGSTPIWYKLPPSAATGTQLPTSDGPTTLVSPGARSSIAFATSSGGTYYTGYVKVSGDGFNRLLSSGGAGGHGHDHDHGHGGGGDEDEDD